MTETVEPATREGSSDRTRKRKLSSDLVLSEQEEDSGPTKKCRQTARASLSQRFWELEQQMCRELSSLSFSSPVTHIYNPLDYARQPHESYLNSYAKSPKRIMFFGMNPGPYGMAQTGVTTISCIAACLFAYRLCFAPVCVKISSICSIRKKFSCRLISPVLFMQSGAVL